MSYINLAGSSKYNPVDMVYRGNYLGSAILPAAMPPGSSFPRVGATPSPDPFKPPPSSGLPTAGKVSIMPVLTKPINRDELRKQYVTPGKVTTATASPRPKSPAIARVVAQKREASKPVVPAGAPATAPDPEAEAKKKENIKKLAIGGGLAAAALALLL